MYEASPGPAHDSLHDRHAELTPETVVDSRTVELLQRYVDEGRILVNSPAQFHQLAYYIETLAHLDPNNPTEAEWAETLVANPSLIFPAVDTTELMTAIAELHGTPDAPPEV